ncbi:retrotransposon protein [Tanacetum coccineum]
MKDKVKSLALKAKVTREKTSDDSNSQDGSNEDVDEEREAEAFNLMARNFRKFFRKGNQFRHENRFGNGGNRFSKGYDNSFGNKDGERSNKKGACYNCRIEGHFASECIKPKENKAFVGVHGAIVKTATNTKNDTTCLMEIDSQEVVSKPSSSNYDLNSIDLQKENEEILRFNKDFTKTFEKLLKEKRTLEDKNLKLSSKINDLEIKVKKLANDKEVTEPCKKCKVLTKEVDSLKCNVSKLQDKALNFSKFKESSIALDDVLSRQKISQDNEGDNSKQQICLASVVDNSTLWHRRLGHASISLRSQVHLTKFDPKSYEGVVLGYSQTSNAYIVLNMEIMRIEEYLNVTFEESLPELKSSPSVKDDRIDEPIVQDLNGSPLWNT